jgi:hypothetical protein
MTISRDLFLAILSMDSYNRGYGVGLTFRQPSSQIGNANIITFPDSVSAGWQAAGFYALAYDMTDMAGGGQFADGERVISYRGTNFAPGNNAQEFLNSPLFRDAWNGWTAGAGFPQASQAQLALDFYRAVAGNACLGKRYGFLGRTEAANDNVTSAQVERMAA